MSCSLGQPFSSPSNPTCKDLVAVQKYKKLEEGLKLILIPSRQGPDLLCGMTWVRLLAQAVYRQCQKQRLEPYEMLWCVLLMLSRSMDCVEGRCSERSYFVSELN